MKKKKHIVLGGPDWVMYNDGAIKMFYVATQSWSPWSQLYLWKPRKINNKWYWLKSVYMRKRIVLYYPKTQWQYQYAIDLFELMQIEGNEL